MYSTTSATSPHLKAQSTSRCGNCPGLQGPACRTPIPAQVVSLTTKKALATLSYSIDTAGASVAPLQQHTLDDGSVLQLAQLPVSAAEADKSAVQIKLPVPVDAKTDSKVLVFEVLQGETWLPVACSLKPCFALQDLEH